MKLGLAQFDILWEDIKTNKNKCEAFFKEAAALGCELLVFPELTLTGFSMNMLLSEERSHGESIIFFQNCCKNYSVGCVFGYAEKEDEHFYNALMYIDKHGNIIADYRKMHPFTYGGEVFSAGDACAAFQLCGADIGLSICYDLRFPELYQQLSKKCSCVIVCANWPEVRKEHWTTLLKARAIENQSFVIGCNRIGVANGIIYSGDSMVISPLGEVISAAESHKEQLICCDIDIDEAERLRFEFPVKNDRRTDIYRNFYE